MKPYPHVYIARAAGPAQGAVTVAAAGVPAIATAPPADFDGVTRFSRYMTRATLTVGAGANQDKARELLERAEKVCLVANSLQGERLLEATVVAKAA